MVLALQEKNQSSRPQTILSALLRQSADLNWLFLLKEALAELSAEGQQRDEDAEQQMRQKLYQDWVCRVWRAVPFVSRLYSVCVFLATFSSCCMSRFPLIIIHFSDFSSLFSQLRRRWQPCCQQVCWVALKLSETQMALKKPFAKGWQLMVMLTRERLESKCEYVHQTGSFMIHQFEIIRIISLIS